MVDVGTVTAHRALPELAQKGWRPPGLCASLHSQLHHAHNMFTPTPQPRSHRQPHACSHAHSDSHSSSQACSLKRGTHLPTQSHTSHTHAHACMLTLSSSHRAVKQASAVFRSHGDRGLWLLNPRDGQWSETREDQAPRQTWRQPAVSRCQGCG